MEQIADYQVQKNSHRPAIDIDLTADPVDVEDPEVRIFLYEGRLREATWRVSHKMTEEDGELHLENREQKPFRALLEVNGLLDEGKYHRLRDQMWEYSSYIVRKDGEFGILYETHFDLSGTDACSNSKVEAWLAGVLPKLQSEFPSLELALPSVGDSPNRLTTLWIFVRSGSLNAESRTALGFALDQLHEDSAYQLMELWCDTETGRNEAAFVQVVEVRGRRLRISLRVGKAGGALSSGRAEVFSPSALQWNEVVSMSERHLRTNIAVLNSRSQQETISFFTQDRNELIRRALMLL